MSAIRNAAHGAATAVPSDTVIDKVASVGIYVGGAGDVKVLTLRGDTVIFKACPVGMIIPVRTKQIFVTGTTATNLVPLYGGA